MPNLPNQPLPRVRVVVDLQALLDPVTGIYARVTQEESLLADLSLPNQRQRALEVCGEHGWLLAKVYCEPKAVGGDEPASHRPALAELLADIEAGRVNRVLVRHTDRLWRSTHLQDELLRVFAKAGVELWDFSHQHDYRSAHGRFSTIVLGAAAQLEKDLTGERIREMKRGKAMAGKPGGGPPPFGYTSQARVRHELVSQGLSPEAAAEEACRRLPAPKKFFVDEKEADVVRLIYTLYTEEHLGCRRITEILNDRGYRRRSGLAWATQKVGRILVDPVVAGFTTYDEASYREHREKKVRKLDQNLYKGEHEAIISLAQWEEAQRLRERNRSFLRLKKAAQRSYALTGILKCGSCGSPMIGKSTGPQSSYAYYQCAKRKYHGPKHGCTAALLPVSLVEATVMADVELLLSSPQFVHGFMGKANERLAAEQPEARKNLARLESELAASERAGAKFTARYEAAADPESEELAWGLLKQAMGRKKTLEAEIAGLRATLAATPAKSVTVEQTARYLATLRLHLQSRPDKLRSLLLLLQARHDLRVRALSERRLVLTIRLDAASVADAGDAFRHRLVVVPGGDDAGAPSVQLLSRELALPKPDTAERWAATENANGGHVCACGCGRAIMVLPVHRYRCRIPKWIRGHHLAECRRGRTKPTP